MYDTIDSQESQACVDSSTSVTWYRCGGQFCANLVAFDDQHLDSQQHQSQGTKYKKQLLSFVTIFQIKQSAKGADNYSTNDIKTSSNHL